MRRYEIANIGDIYAIADAGEMSIVEYMPIFGGVEKSRELQAEFLNIVMPFLDIKECDMLMVSLGLSSSHIDHIISHIFSSKTLESMGFDDPKIEKVIKYIESNRIGFVRLLRHYFKYPPCHVLDRRTFFIDGLLYEKDKNKYEKIITGKYCGRVISHFSPFITGFIYGKYIDKETLEAVKQLSAHKDVAIYSEEEFNKLVV